MSYRSALAAYLATVCVAATAATESPTKPSTPATATPSTVQPASGPAPASSGTTTAATKPASPHAATSPAGKSTKKTPEKPAKKVDLNNASLAELQSLPTVGEAEAKQIIANRPYMSKGELVTKAGLPMGVYQAIRYKVELQKPRQAAPKK